MYSTECTRHDPAFFPGKGLTEYLGVHCMLVLPLLLYLMRNAPESLKILGYWLSFTKLQLWKRAGPHIKNAQHFLEDFGGFHH